MRWCSAALLDGVGVGGHRRDVEPVDAADVDDAGRIVGGAGLLEQRQERAGEEERRLQVEVEHLVPRRLGEGLQRLAQVAPALLTRMCSLVLALADLLGQPVALRLGGEVGGDRDDLAELAELGDGGLARVGLARADVDPAPAEAVPGRS